MRPKMSYIRLWASICVISAIFSLIQSAAIEQRDTLSELTFLPDGVVNKRAGGENEDLLPQASRIQEYTPDSHLVKELRFYASLCRTVNCRSSLNNWDCLRCLRVLPDGVVLNYFNTSPSLIVGQIVRSKSKKTIFVQIRGANSQENVDLFLDDKLVPYPPSYGAFVHRGCLTALNEIKETMVATIADQVALHRNYKVTVIGHSFGGCVASLAALELLQRVKNLRVHNFALYTLGKARVGNRAFVEYHDSTGIDHKRIVNKADPMCHVPALTKGYLHEGVEHWAYDDQQNIKKCIGGESRSCSNSVSNITSEDHFSYLGTIQVCDNATE